jgi:anti-sigma regulatory factor (Ser/Thr protein kinase)
MRIPAMATEKHVQIDLPPDRSAARAARDAVAALTANEEAQLVVGELVTNAVMHGSPPISLSATPLATGLRVEVRDGRPDLGPAAPDSRGLRLVQAIALQWGIDSHSDGKVVWAFLPI